MKSKIIIRVVTTHSIEVDDAVPDEIMVERARKYRESNLAFLAANGPQVLKFPGFTVKICDESLGKLED